MTVQRYNIQKRKIYLYIRTRINERLYYYYPRNLIRIEIIPIEVFLYYYNIK